MTTTLHILFSFFLFAVQLEKPSVKVSNQQIREAYFAAANDTKLCEALHEIIKPIEEESEVKRAYIGILETIIASGKTNPFTKLKWFNMGKANIEKAIKKDSVNPELRFIRLSVQVKAPSFLFYNTKIKEDKQMVFSNIKYFQSIGIKKNVTTFLKMENIKP